MSLSPEIATYYQTYKAMDFSYDDDYFEELVDAISKEIDNMTQEQKQELWEAYNIIEKLHEIGESEDFYRECDEEINNATQCL